jgi:hypothetical protein
MFAGYVDQLVEFDSAGLDAEFRRLELLRRETDARLAAVTALIDQRQTDVADGHRGVFNYVRGTAEVSRGEATRRCRLARLVDSVDGVGEALMSGALGVAQADELARLRANQRCGHRIAEFAGHLLEAGATLAFDEREAVASRRDATLTEVDGTVHLAARGGDPVRTAEMIEVFRRFVDREFERDVARRAAEHGDDAATQPLARDARQRRFDALHEIFVHAAMALAGEGKRLEPLVTILGDVETFTRTLRGAGWLPDTGLDGRDLVTDLLVDADDLVGRRCVTSTGIAVHPRDLLQAALAGQVGRVVLDAASIPIDYGRQRRLFTGPARKAAQLLASWCEHPGCGLSSAVCEIDHMAEWERDHGHTDLWNAAVGCGKHNRFKHARRLTVRRGRNRRAYVIRPDGTVVLPVGHPPPDFLDLTDPTDPIGAARQAYLERRAAADDPGEQLVHIRVHIDDIDTFVMPDLCAG